MGVYQQRTVLRLMWAIAAPAWLANAGTGVRAEAPQQERMYVLEFRLSEQTPKGPRVRMDPTLAFVESTEVHFRVDGVLPEPDAEAAPSARPIATTNESASKTKATTVVDIRRDLTVRGPDPDRIIWAQEIRGSVVSHEANLAMLRLLVECSQPVDAENEGEYSVSGQVHRLLVRLKLGKPRRIVLARNEAEEPLRWIDVALSDFNGSTTPPMVLRNF